MAQGAGSVEPPPKNQTLKNRKTTTCYVGLAGLEICYTSVTQGLHPGLYLCRPFRPKNYYTSNPGEVS